MSKLWILACVLVPVTVASVCIHGLTGRVRRLEDEPRVGRRELRAIDDQLALLEARVQGSIGALRVLANGQMRTEVLNQRLAELERELRLTACAIEEQRDSLTRLDVEQELGPRRVNDRLDSLEQGVERQWNAVEDVATRAMDVARRASTDLAQVERSLERDKSMMWRDLLGPTVQLMGEETVGSGVLLASEPLVGTKDWVTYVITAWHVIRDIQTTPENLNTPVPVTIYMRDGQVRPETAVVLKYDTGLDIALLRLNGSRPVDCGAKLASRQRLGDVAIFERIYAVGCPLGNDPIPTFGEIADTRHQVDNQTYWMISAPTYIGNSGGGVFDAETHELLGIFTKIYTHGTLRPTVVPHMGLVTPLPAIYDWLEQIGFANLEASAENRTRTASASR